MITTKLFKLTEFNTITALGEIGAENVRYLDSGKPVADNCFVSASHSADTLAVCKSDRPVGIDIEKTDVPRDFKRLSRRVFSPSELEYYEKQRTPESFYEIWTRKEAYAKISGDGMRMIFKGLDTFSLKDVIFKTKITDGYIITVCEKL